MLRSIICCAIGWCCCWNLIILVRKPSCCVRFQNTWSDVRPGCMYLPLVSYLVLQYFVKLRRQSSTIERAEQNERPRPPFHPWRSRRRRSFSRRRRNRRSHDERRHRNLHPPFQRRENGKRACLCLTFITISLFG